MPKRKHDIWLKFLGSLEEKSSMEKQDEHENGVQLAK